MNIADSEKLAEIFESAGYQPAEDPKMADFILVNTCVVRQGAEDKAAWYVTSAKGLKKDKPNMKIGLCGCLVTEPGRDVKKEFPHVDLFVPPHSPEVLAEFLKQDAGHRPQDSKPKSEITKYIPIMTGCDNFCSYCVVPYVRGRETSRPIEDVLDEIKKSCSQEVRQSGSPGIKEIFLLGQNVNSYKYGLAKLLRIINSELDTHHSLLRIRFMTSHPKDMSDDIIQAVAELPHVCEYFHLPIQHGSDRILKLMNRGYTVADYCKIVEKIRAKIPGAAITGDMIVGYPGETEEDFRLTLYIIEQIGFDAVNTAAYSVRPGTAAAKLKDDVPAQVKQERLQKIMAVVNDVAKKQNDKLVGTVQEVLVDQKGKGLFAGRTRTNKIVKFPAESKDLLGQTVNVKITSSLSWLLKGDLVNGKL